MSRKILFNHKFCRGFRIFLPSMTALKPLVFVVINQLHQLDFWICEKLPDKNAPLTMDNCQR